MKKMIAGGVVLVMLLLVFLSGTFYNFNLPLVTAVMPSRGQLNYLEITSGSVSYARETEIYARMEGWAGTVNVSRGDEVKKGDVLIEMDFRGKDEEVLSEIQTLQKQFNEQLETQKLSLLRNEIDIDRIDTNILNLQRQIEESDEQSFSEESVSDFELMRNLEEIERAEIALEQVQILFDAGAATRQELINAENKVSELNSTRLNLEQIYRENNQKNEDKLTDWETSVEKQKSELLHQLELLEKDKKSKQLDIESLALQESTLRRELNDKLENLEALRKSYSEAKQIIAPVDGTLKDFNINSGQFISNNQLIAGFGESEDFVIETTLPLSNNFVAVGSEVKLYNTTHNFKGVVKQIRQTEFNKEIIIAFEEEGVTEGEPFTVEFEAKSVDAFVLVPNGAINLDGDGHFVNQIKRRDGVMGSEYYTEKISVTIGDADGDNTAILKGITFFEPLSLLSDKPFSEGETIRLRNEGDFFDN